MLSTVRIIYPDSLRSDPQTSSDYEEVRKFISYLSGYQKDPTNPRLKGVTPFNLTHFTPGNTSVSCVYFDGGMGCGMMWCNVPFLEIHLLIMNITNYLSNLKNCYGVSTAIAENEKHIKLCIDPGNS